MLNLPTKILPRAFLDRVKRARPLYAAGRRVRFALGSRLGAREVAGLRGRVHYNDFMLTSPDPDHVGSYHRGAVQFVGILEQSLREAGRTFADVRACLEVGCGYGRIVRELRDRVPAARIHVTDVIDEGARFTAAEFGATRVPLIENAGANWESRFDLIYLLSVYTHMPREAIATNLKALVRLLKPGGVVVFTIHGQGSADTAERYDQYWLDKDKVLSALRTEGFYYERYSYYSSEYGLTWFTPDALRTLVASAAPDLEPAAFHPLAVDEHQDVFVYRRRSAT